MASDEELLWVCNLGITEREGGREREEREEKRDRERGERERKRERERGEER